MTNHEDSPRFTFDVSNPTAFSFAIGKYVVHQRKRAIPISVFALGSRPNAEEHLALLERMLAVLVQEFGEYPHGELELVEVPDAQTGSAFSLEGFVIVNSSQLDALNPALIAHELGHQWWGDSVSPRGEDGRFLLTEAMAQYGALRVVERLYGPEAANRFRRSGYPGYDFFQNGLGYLILAATGGDAPLLRAGHPLANSKGFLVHDLLARTIGRDRFRAILRRFTSDFAFADVSWEMYRDAAVTAGAGKPMRWFFEQWYERAGVPEWRVTWSQQGPIVRGSINQQGPFYRTEIELLLIGPEGSLLQRLKVDGARTAFKWQAPFRITEIVIDPTFVVPHWSPSLRAEAEALAPLGRGFLLLREGRANDARAELERALSAIGPEDPYSARFVFRLFLSFLATTDAARAAHLDAALASATRRQDMLPFAYYTRAELSKRMKDYERLVEFVTNARTAEAVLGVSTGYAAAARRLLTGPTR